MSVNLKFVVMLPTNATNAGDPAKRAFVIDHNYPADEEHAADIIGWLHANGIQAKVVTFDKFHEKLQNYRDRVDAAS